MISSLPLRIALTLSLIWHVTWIHIQCLHDWCMYVCMYDWFVPFGNSTKGSLDRITSSWHNTTHNTNVLRLACICWCETPLTRKITRWHSNLKQKYLPLYHRHISVIRSLIFVTTTGKRWKSHITSHPLATKTDHDSLSLSKMGSGLIAL